MTGLLGWLAATLHGGSGHGGSAHGGSATLIAQPAAPSVGAANAIPERTFYLGIGGETLANPDGTSRQRIIKRCRAGEPIVLVSEPYHPYDYLAVAVRRRATAERIGYLPRGHGLTLLIEQHRVVAAIAEVIGGTWSKPTRRVVLEITVSPATPKLKHHPRRPQVAD